MYINKHHNLLKCKIKHLQVYTELFFKFISYEYIDYLYFSPIRDIYIPETENSDSILLLKYYLKISETLVNNLNVILHHYI